MRVQTIIGQTSTTNNRQNVKNRPSFGTYYYLTPQLHKELKAIGPNLLKHYGNIHKQSIGEAEKKLMKEMGGQDILLYNIKQAEKAIESFLDKLGEDILLHNKNKEIHLLTNKNKRTLDFMGITFSSKVARYEHTHLTPNSDIKNIIKDFGEQGLNELRVNIDSITYLIKHDSEGLKIKRFDFSNPEQPFVSGNVMSDVNKVKYQNADPNGDNFFKKISSENLWNRLWH